MRRIIVYLRFVSVKVILDLFLIKILCLMQDQIKSDFKKWSTCRYNVGVFNNFKNFVKCYIWHLIWFSSFIWSFSRGSMFYNRFQLSSAMLSRVSVSLGYAQGHMPRFWKSQKPTSVGKLRTGIIIRLSFGTSLYIGNILELTLIMISVIFRSSSKW